MFIENTFSCTIPPSKPTVRILQTLFLAIVTILAVGCANNSAYYYTHHPSLADKNNIRTVAIAEFDGIERSGAIVSDKLAEGIVNRQHFRLVERKNLDAIIAEHDLNQSGVVDPATARDLRLLGVHGLIFGMVDAFNIDSQTGVEKITREVKTGKTREVVRTNAAGESETVEEEIIETVTRDRGYILKKGTLSATFRLADIQTGEILAIKTESANFSERFWRDSKKQPPTKDQLLNKLTKEVAARFLHEIHPKTISHRVTFEENELGATELAIKYAQTNLWEQAYAKFLLASEQAPLDPRVHYNLSISAKVLGNTGQALSAIQKAIDLNPDTKYIQWLSTLEHDTR